MSNYDFLYVADTYNNAIRVINPSGTISTYVGTGFPGYSPDGTSVTYATLNTPQGVAIDASGHLYVADTGNNVIRIVK